MKDFKNKVVVITGAGSGIGRALAHVFAQKGAKLALNDNHSDKLEATVAELKGFPQSSVFSHVYDVADKAAVFEFAALVKAHFGQIDVVVNNAGIASAACNFADLELDVFERIMDVNFKGVLYGSKAFFPLLLERPAAALVNISSIFGLAGIQGSSAYCTSKFAVNGLNQTLIQETYGTSICVHSVHPGGISTDIGKNAINADQETIDFAEQHLKHPPSMAAETIIRGIQKKKHRILIGAEAYQLDYLVRLAPIAGSRLINKIAL